MHSQGTGFIQVGRQRAAMMGGEGAVPPSRLRPDGVGFCKRQAFEPCSCLLFC